MTKIEWTEETWNPVTGCTKCSEGCQNCYAEKMHKRLRGMGSKKYQHDFNQVVCHPEELDKDFGKKPKMIFVNSMADLFHKDVPDDFIHKVVFNCFFNPAQVFQILTKRAERLPHYGKLNYKSLNSDYSGKFPSNVWLGVTVEKAENKARIKYLKQTAAKVKFLSCEPLLGDLGKLDLTGIDWVIVGGESGHKARPMHPDWVRNIQKQCAEQGVAFYFKQWGEYSVAFERDSAPYDTSESKYYHGKYRRLNFAGGIGYHGENLCYMQKVGKKKAGCLLDGKEYKEYPKVGKE